MEKTLLLLVCVCVHIQFSLLQRTPCPKVFQFTSDSTGEINVKNYEQYGKGKTNLTITVSFAKKLKKSAEINVEPIGDIDDIKNDINYKLIFPNVNIYPEIEKISVNRYTICRGNPARGDKTTTLSAFSLIIGNEEDEDEDEDFSEPIPKPNINDKLCGRSAEEKLVGFSYHGTEAVSGQWPWLVSILLKQGFTLNFHCGGTLVSHKVVVTAGHCMFIDNDHIDRINLRVSMGSLDQVSSPLNVFQETVHKDFRSTSSKEYYDADLAILILEKRVEYNNNIRPICLDYLGNFNLDNQYGSLPGWGKNEYGKLSEKVRFFESQVVSRRQCLQSVPEFSESTSDRTFCAGRKDYKSGPCNGDSGGGFVVKTDGIWYLRGVLSHSFVKPDGSCDVSKYAVYTDVSQFLPWIKQSIDKFD